MKETKLDYEVYKCSMLIKMLIRRGLPPEMALDNYSRNIYEKAKFNALDIFQGDKKICEVQ